MSHAVADPVKNMNEKGNQVDTHGIRFLKVRETAEEKSKSTNLAGGIVVVVESPLILRLIQSEPVGDVLVQACVRCGTPEESRASEPAIQEM